MFDFFFVFSIGLALTFDLGMSLNPACEDLLRYEQVSDMVWQTIVHQQCWCKFDSQITPTAGSLWCSTTSEAACEAVRLVCKSICNQLAPHLLAELAGRGCHLEEAAGNPAANPRILSIQGRTTIQSVSLLSRLSHV